MTLVDAKIVFSAIELTKVYRSGETLIHAVDGINLSLDSGSMLAIMGASGSGKTTLLHLLAGLVRPDSGRVEVNGQDLFSVSDRKITAIRRRYLGLVFQSFNLMPTLNAIDNVAVPLLLDGMGKSAAKKIAVEKMALVGLSNRVHHKPEKLSGWEQQRVAIARALVADPKVLLADEPTGNLDRENALDVCKLLRKVADHGRAVLVVTHDIEVAAIANRIVVLSDGRVADDFNRSEVGSVEELGSRYLHAIRSIKQKDRELKLDLS